MTQKIILSLIVILFSTGIYSQNCEAYIPTKKGEKVTYKVLNRRGKVESYYSEKVLTVKDEEGKTKYEIQRKNFDKKKKLTTSDTLTYYCENNMFYIDMTSMLSSEQLSSYDEAMVEFEFDNIGYPAGMKVGTTLKDGYIEANILVGIPITFRTDVTSRNVVSSEKITTEAGTFQTLKIEEDVKARIGFVKINMKVKTWVKQGIGNIKSESYDKKGKLITATELVENW